ncbi:hypothetical protein F4820DRAFT_343210 [Hypoxylon rubiginosum]|uniref:Uncharacterized protein n=1 Tax=Hypoxylon rubiginosum TaxID=110542 RepID=A0ACB9ZE97_9PEZI|nr:hypothetical protein F4820DRAFT_343210 [Hypoxylon rubiginosum]
MLFHVFPFPMSMMSSLFLVFGLFLAWSFSMCQRHRLTTTGSRPQHTTHNIHTPPSKHHHTHLRWVHLEVLYSHLFPPSTKRRNEPPSWNWYWSLALALAALALGQERKTTEITLPGLIRFNWLAHLRPGLCR